MKTVRDIIADLLREHVSTVNGEVWEPGAADESIPKPFLVVREGISVEPNSYDKSDTSYEVWPYVPRTSLANLDKLIEEVLEAINYAIVVVNETPHYLQYTGTGSEDMIVEDWDAYTKVMNFDLIALDWRTHSEVKPDPIDGMVKWTNEFFDFQTDPKMWIPSDEAPAVYWRQSQVLSTEPTPWGGFVNAQIRGHVISPSPEIRKRATEVIARHLMTEGHTHLSDKSVMLFREVSTNDGYNPFTEGQITLSVRYGVLSIPRYPPLRKAYVENEKVKGVAKYDEEE